MTEQEGKGYHQGITATKTFEYEDTRSYFKYCYYWEIWYPLSEQGYQEPKGH